ncbi:DUF4252 domain-containing protein [Patiriisocius sp. Uisw_017]|jgi:hypothetical protein|uniref:DUF4252 domain-containing protein n=1 Tax=Patiriisocius sp. Uisw_017 TaxID=3230968 RepID=UPI0039EACA6C
MVTIIKYILAFTLASLTLMSCDTSKSLQSYIVDKQEDDRFMKIDLATSLLTEMESLPEDQKMILKTVKKMNVVAYPKKEGTDAEYNTEKDRLSVIFDQEQYKQLGSFNVNGQNVSLMYLGDENAIDEVIVYGRDDDKGLVVFRLLGDEMNPSELIKLSNVIEKGDLDLSKLAGMEDIFKE